VLLVAGSAVLESNPTRGRGSKTRRLSLRPMNVVPTASVVPANHIGFAAGGRFDLGDSIAYNQWRNDKLCHLVRDLDAVTVHVADLAKPTSAELVALQHTLCQHNLVRYRSGQAEVERSVLRRFAAKLGLLRADEHLCADEDGISELADAGEGGQGDYIPYTNKALNWHCDGYYNAPEDRIHAMLLHCVRPATEGGWNAFLDHEWVYIALRDQNPAWIDALMQEDAFTIPENVQDGVCLRPDRSGPVFSVDPQTGVLHMRYTARRRNIVWRDDPVTRAAREALERILEDPASPILRGRQAPGEGIVCSNVLHNRTSFKDGSEGPGRLVLRARFLDHPHCPESSPCYG
jgi:hypothetical protein